MVDTGLIAKELKLHGHEVGDVFPVPNNAGEYEFIVDGNVLTLAEARALLEADEA